jgi:hypothetical protein
VLVVGSWPGALPDRPGAVVGVVDVVVVVVVVCFP